MSHFYGSVSGQSRTEATRCGAKTSGIGGHIRGWDTGVAVTGQYNEATEQDEFIVSKTGGSNGNGRSEPIATIIGDKVIHAPDQVPLLVPDTMVPTEQALRMIVETANNLIHYVDPNTKDPHRDAWLALQASVKVAEKTLGDPLAWQK